MNATIYHNPKCSTSRNALALLREAGIEPAIIEYLKTPPDRPTLLGLIDAIGGGPRGILRKKAPPYAELGLDNPAISDEALVDAILAHPELIERPIVITAKGTVLCRPLEKLNSVL